MSVNSGTKRARAFGYSVDGNRMYAHLASSADQLAVVWGENGVVVASPKSGPGGTYSLDVVRFPSDFNLGAAIEMRRRGQLGLPPTSEQTLLLTVVSDYSERTRILALDGERLAFGDDELAEWLVHAEQQMFAGTDNHPIFETSLEETACAIGRLPNGQVAMTEVPRPQVDNARERMRSLAGPAAKRTNLIVETPVRCVARYFLTAVREGDAALHGGRDKEVTAFLLIGRGGFSFGLWSPRSGLFHEYSFIAPKDLESKTAASKDDGGKLEAYIRRAFEQMIMQLSPERLEQLQLDTYSQIVWASDSSLAERIAPIADEYAAKSGLTLFPIAVPVDEAVAGGLLFGSFGFGDEQPSGARKMPPMNLARDLLVMSDTEQLERRQQELADAAKRKNRAVFTILAAPVMAAALLLAYTANLVRENIALAYREYAADARTQELKPALDRRKSYETNLQWYQEFVTQVSELRKQQPVGIGMLYQLDANYPLTLDPAFYVSELKLDPKGAMEMRGLARNKDAIAAFLKSLEFAGGAESGSRLFANLAYEVQEGTPMQAVAGRPPMPGMTGSTLTGSAIAPGVISWSMKGSYLPLAKLAPPEPKPGTPPAQQTVAAAPPAK
ncbi:MAG: hypothetical protein QUS14_02785 [Pyrinomonadaceae bacterium]|nr:hypothetical protein [Pyrinomonadaceae bacterium]